MKEINHQFGNLRLSKGREVGRNQVKIFCQLWHQFTKHVAAAWETMQ